MKIFNLFLFVFILIIAKSSSAYIPAHLEQLKQTGICIDCDLSEAKLRSHDHIDLTGALLTRAFFDGHFNVSDFSGAQMMYANLSYVQASGSNFSSADLTGAQLVYTNFSSSNFENANLHHANLTGANLARSNITMEQLAQADSIECAILPDGVKHMKNGQPC